MRRNGRNFFSMTTLAKKFLASFVFACVLVGTGYAGLSRASAATAPRIIMYQGRLLNSNGVPVSDASASIMFKLFDASSGGTCLWSNNSSACTSPAARTVTLTAGLFSEPLGDTAAATPYAAIPATVFQNNTSVYLEITVGSDAAMSPRKQMLAAPYAMNSDVLDGYDTSLTGGTSSIVPVTDANGNLVITGSPQGTGVSQGSLYVNPATTTANFTLFGVAIGGVMQFNVDKEGDVAIVGDTVMTGDLTVNGGDLSSTAATFNLLNTGTAGLTTINFASTLATLNIGDGAGAKTIDIGGVTADGTDAIHIGTSSTSADVIAIGNANASTTLGLIGGTAWSVGTNGLFTTSNSMEIGDVTGNDGVVITSATTAGKVLYIVDNGLTTGYGMNIQKTNDTGSDFSGSLALIEQLDAGAASGGRVMDIVQNGLESSAHSLYITQAQTSAHSGDTAAGSAVTIDVLEAGSTDDAIILRNNVGISANTSFRVTSGGNTFMDGVLTSASVAVGSADYAEFFKTTDSALDGRMMVCQAVGVNAVKRCEAGETQVMGIVSTDPGIIGNNTREDYRDELADPTKSLVGLMGQIETLVDSSGGAIAVGDPISTSSTTAGYGAKANGPVRIVGFALEPLSSGTGTIRVLVQPQWYGGDVLTSTGSATQVSGSLAIIASTRASASTTAVDSASLSLNGSAWNGSSATTTGMMMKTTVSAVDDYRLSIMNASGTEVASVDNGGNLALAGKFYPSDRGASQRNKYIYYDGSSGSGGDFMRTNAAGWSTGSYDFAEMFPSPDALVAGEIVTFGDASQQVKRSIGSTYDQGIAGIVSTRPGFLAGENAQGNYPIALSGRVPTLVSTENGAIKIGDPLTTSTTPGYAMRATEAGPILGYAAEAFEGSTGKIIVYVNVSYYGGQRVSHGPATENSISNLAADISHFDTTGSLNFNAGQLLAVGSMTSASGAWRLESGGDLVTSGRLVELVRSTDGTDVKTYPATSTQTTVQLAGAATLMNGHADVKFADVDAAFSGIIDQNPTYRALVTPYGATGTLYVTNRTVNGFTITESGSASNNVQVDWLIIATRRDFATGAAPVVVAPVVVVPTEPIVVAPSESAGTTPTEPVGAVPAESGVTAPTEPEIAVPTEQGGTSSAGSTEPVASAIPSDSPVNGGETTVTPEADPVTTPVVVSESSPTNVTDTTNTTNVPDPVTTDAPAAPDVPTAPAEQASATPSAE